jgi:Ca-activated chloride channel family protein
MLAWTDATMPVRTLRTVLVVVAVLCAAPAGGSPAPPAPAAEPAEAARQFFEEGPALLVPEAERQRLAAAPEAERIAFARDFLARDPLPETPDNELVAAIAARRRRMAAEKLSPFDDRGRLIFLHGPPTDRHQVECATAFVPIEVWTWGQGAQARQVVLYRPSVDRHFRRWLPTDSKRPLYSEEMEYLIEQVEELRRMGARIRGKRPDLAFCDDAALLDRVTGVRGLHDFEPGRMRDADVEARFAPPADLAAWARAALAESTAGEPPALPAPEVAVSYPARRDQRLVARLRLDLPPDSLVAAEAGSGREMRVALTGTIERPDGIFEEFRTRFVFAPPAPGTPVVLLVERALRPQERFVARLEVRDETSGKVAWLSRELAVPAEPTAEPEPAPAGAVVGQDLGLSRLTGRDSLVLLPPTSDVVFGLYRADAIVVGDRIRKVVFYLDGKPQFTRSAPPWSAELRLPNIPREALVRAEGQDESGAVVAADEVLLNEPQGEARVRLLEPPRGRKLSGEVRARAAVVVPEGRRVERVEFKVNDAVVATLERPPWETRITVPGGTELAYLTVSALYDDGTRVEDFRVLNSTEFFEQVEVDLVELFVTVTDRDGQLVENLTAADFSLRDNDRAQEISKFELVRELPLTVGLVLDTSGSMAERLAEAKRAASDFLANVITPKDRCFAVGFAERPALLMPITSDARGIEVSFRELPAIGATSLHDALVFSLYQMRGVRGRRALVLLSDGDDTSSLVPWQDAMSYAQRAGVAIYAIGLDIGAGSLGVRRKLENLAAETGGRALFVERASDLAGAYETIERELRSQYFLAFAPQPAPKEGERHELEVEVRGGHRVRTARGYTAGGA